MGLDFLLLGLIYKYPHWGFLIIFFALILAGCNLPVSEDLMILTSGFLASAVIPEHTFHLWLALFLGAYLGDWISYWTGRLLGPRILRIKWMKRWINQERVDKMHDFYERYGFFAFLIGRFIPFGFRNCLFLSSGMGRMSFKRFLWIDGIASLVSTALGFYLAYTFGEHWEGLFAYLKSFDMIVWVIVGLTLALLLAILGFLWYRKKKRLKASSYEDPA